MKKTNSLILISLLLIAAFVMNACGGAAPAAPESTLVKLCIDPRCAFTPSFGQGHFSGVAVDYSIGGGASIPPIGYREAVEATTGTRVRRVALISHMCGDSAACGGLNGSAQIMSGTYKGSDELAQYLRNSLPSPDEYYGLFRAQDAWVKTQKVMDGWAGIQDGLSGKIYPQFFWEDGKIVNQVLETEWERFLKYGGELPSLAKGGWPQYMTDLLAANERAIPAYTSLSRALQFENGAKFRNVVVATSLDPALLSQFENGTTAIITSTRAGAIDLGGQLSYVLSHKKSLSGGSPFKLMLQADNPQQLSLILGDLNYSPTLNEIIANASDETMVVWWRGLNKWNPMLRDAYVPMSRLVAPISGGSGTVTLTMSVPALVDETAVATAMADSGIAVEKSALTRLVEVLRPFAGQTVRVLAIGLDYLLKANDIVFVSYVAYQVTAETGQVLFRYGPEWPLSITGVGGYDPTGGNEVMFQRIYQDPMINMQATSQYSTDVGSIWDHIQEQVAKGEQPCVFLTASQDSQTPMPVVCATNYVKDDPKELVFYWSDGQTMSVPFTENWQTAESGKVTWTINTMDPSLTCQGGAFVEGLPVTFYLRPSCY